MPDSTGLGIVLAHYIRKLWRRLADVFLQLTNEYYKAQFQLLSNNGDVCCDENATFVTGNKFAYITASTVYALFALFRVSLVYKTPEKKLKITDAATHKV